MIKVIGYTVETIGNEILIQDSEGESVQSADVNVLIDFLHEPFPEYLAIKVFWDLDTALAPILRKLGVSACKQLASPTHTYEDLFYITSKLFRIDRYKRLSFFYHVSQYYSDEEIEPNDPEIVCGMAQNVLDAFKAMGLHPKKLTSPVAIYESEVLSHMKIPTILNIPGAHEEIITYAEECMGFPDRLHFWIQAYKIGHWLEGDIFEYDLKSAYPFQAMRLPSLQYAKYAKARTTKFQYSMNYDKLGGEPDWGFMRGIVTINDDVKVSPIFCEDGTQRTGTFRTSITWQDYQFIKKWDIGDFKIESGYFLKFTSFVYPMEQTMRRLFNQRGHGGLTDTLAKRISTAVGFGKFLEKHDDGTVGNYYNPPYAAMIISLSNLRVAEFIYKNKLQDDLVHVGVDSVSSTKEAKVGDQMRVGIGDWRFSGIGAMLVLSSGRVYHGDKKPQGMNYGEIVDLIKAHPRETFYATKLRRRQTLEESIQLNDLNGLDKYKLTNSSFDLGILRSNIDRIYKDFPKNGHDLLTKQYDSLPLKYENNTKNY